MTGWIRESGIPALSFWRSGDCLAESARMKTSARSAGILLPAFSPRREGDLGIGDTRALREWIVWASARGIGFLQLLPINETGADNSPYNAVSSVALDPVYLSCDAEDLPGITTQEVETARMALGGAADARLVDYPAVRAAKDGLLRTAWSRFDAAADDLHDEFSRFRRDEADWLDDYVLFRTLMDETGLGEAWDQWPADLRTPEGARAWLDAGRRTRPQETADRTGFHAWVQWLCFRQWRGLARCASDHGVKLMGDIPIGVSWHSVDVFFHRADFDTSWFGGAPPETMFRHDRFIQQWGQNWGVPLYRWARMQAQGFPWWSRRIAKLTEIFRIFRIDHILGFYRIYAFPWHPRRNSEFLDVSEEEAWKLADGKLPGWAPRPDDTEENKEANRADGDVRLRAVLAAADGADVVGEDLGCVPDYVRPHLASLGIEGFRIPHWDCDAEDHVLPGSAIPECSFATYATHDHETMSTLWNACRHTARDPQAADGERMGAHRNLRLMAEFARIPVSAPDAWPEYGDAVQWSLIKALFACQSRHAALMVTDLFGLDDRYNRPGTVGGENWRFRLPWSLRAIEADATLRAVGTRLAGLVGTTRRTPR